MASPTEPLIVGAGPVGLAAALFLARAGVKTRVIEATSAPSPYSKALAVNPRTLEILEPTGITEQMLAIGKKVVGGQFWRHGSMAAEISFSCLADPHPYMLALSQAVTVRLLEASLGEQGVHVERGLKLTTCATTPDGAEASIEWASGSIETTRVPWLFAADGAHSVARHAMGIAFEGNAFEQPWYLVDVPLQTSLPEDQAYIMFLDGGGFRFMLRVVDEQNTPPGDPLWRVIGDDEDLLTPIKDVKASGPPFWRSQFKIAHRINDRLQSGNVYFAGDAAHIHSPMGARGMNLGIEDAWVFAELYKQNRLQEYGAMRRAVDRKVVRRIELVTRMIRGASTLSKVVRSTAIPLATHLPMVRNRMVQMLTGLDHALAV